MKKVLKIPETLSTLHSTREIAASSSETNYPERAYEFIPLVAGARRSERNVSMKISGIGEMVWLES